MDSRNEVESEGKLFSAITITLANDTISFRYASRYSIRESYDWNDPLASVQDRRPGQNQYPAHPLRVSQWLQAR